jgi:hypothetical protein
MSSLASVDLTRPSDRSRNDPTGQGVLRYTAVTARRLIIPAAITLVLLGSGVSVLLLKEARMRGEHPGLLSHAALVSEILIRADVSIGDLRFTLRSAKWVHQASPGPVKDGRDRLYLDVAFQNQAASPRAVGRAEFSLVGQNGASRLPLAAELPPIALAPGERLSTTLAFDEPPPAAHLEFARGPTADKARLSIPDDPLGGLFGALCRAVARPWRS